MESIVSTGHASRWGLSDHKMFELLRETVPPDVLSQKSLMCFNKDILYVWNLHESCLFALNVHSVNGDNKHAYVKLIPSLAVSNQKVTFSNKLQFNVDSIKINELSTLCVIVGAQEIAVLEVPAYFKNVFFQGGERSIFCKCSSIDGQYFSRRDCIIQQVQWHPAPELDNRLIVLTSLNELRIYEIKCAQDVKFISTWSTVSDPSLLTCNHAVDFDIAPPVLENAAEENPEVSVLLWPVLVLFKNGDVVIINYLTSKKTRQALPEVSKPLSVHPSVNDHKSDACSLLVLPSVPPLIIIAKNCGIIHHYFLLSESKDTQSENTNQIEKSLSTPALYLLESVELEQSCNLSTPPKRQVYLFKNPAINSQYFCSHDIGVIIVNMPLISELSVFAETDDSDLESTLPSLDHSSTCEYLVHTQDNNTSDHHPILGLTVIDSPATLVAFSRKQVLSLPLTAFTVAAAALNFSPFKKIEPIKKPSQPAFDESVTNLLKLVYILPQSFLKLGAGSECSSQKCLELVSRVISETREECFPCYETVQDIIRKRVCILKNMKMRQFEELAELDGKKVELYAAAKELFEKCRKASESQKSLSGRTERALKLVSCLQSSPDVVAKKAAADLQNFKDKIKLKPAILKHAFHTEINNNKNISEKTVISSNDTMRPEENPGSANNVDNTNIETSNEYCAKNGVVIKQEDSDSDDLEIIEEVPKSGACKNSERVETTDGEPARKKLKINAEKSSVSSSAVESKGNEKLPPSSAEVPGTPHELNKPEFPPESTVFLSYIPPLACRGPVIKFNLEPYVGKNRVLSVVCPRDKFTGAPRGLAIVTCTDKLTAQKLLQLNFKMTIYGKKIKIQEYKPRNEPLKITENQLFKISVSNLPQSTTEEAFKTKFLEFVDEADISNIEFPLHTDGKSQGYAFITLKNNEAMKKLLALHQNLEIGGNKLNIRIRSEDSVPPSVNQAAEKQVNKGHNKPSLAKRSRNASYNSQTSLNAGFNSATVASWNSNASNFCNSGNQTNGNEGYGSARSYDYSHVSHGNLSRGNSSRGNSSRGNFSRGNLSHGNLNHDILSNGSSNHQQQNISDVERSGWRKKAYEFIHGSGNFNQGTEQNQGYASFRGNFNKNRRFINNHFN